MTLAVPTSVSVDTTQIAAAIGNEFVEAVLSLSVKPLASEVAKVDSYLVRSAHQTRYNEGIHTAEVLAFNAVSEDIALRGREPVDEWVLRTLPCGLLV